MAPKNLKKRAKKDAIKSKPPLKELTPARQPRQRAPSAGAKAAPASTSAPASLELPADFFNDRHEKLAALREESLSRAEKAFAIVFPTAYVAFLRIKNGGYIQYTEFPSEEPKKHELRGSSVPVRGIAGIDNGSRDYDIVKLNASMGRWGVDPTRFVALDGEGHYWICFDKQSTNAAGEPTIAYVASESGSSGPIAHCTIAQDFRSFVLGLKRDEY
jgi:SMI1-KNR4 cell-wall